ncbi:MAG: peptidoglycan DD-metalloendopeptidase family protein [Burkholderiales bacterium]
MIAQNLTSTESKRRVRWAVATLALPLFGIVAAFGIAPSTRTENVRTQVVEQSLASPFVATQAASSDEVFSRQERVRRGDTVASILSRLQVDDAEADQFLRTDSTAQAIYGGLVPGRVIETQVSEEGELVGLKMRTGGNSILKVIKVGDELVSLEETIRLEKRIEFKAGVIKSSLFAATDAADVPDTIATQLSKLFATDIDFHQDLRKNDQFSIAYEAFYDGPELIRVGRLVAAEFINRGTSHRLVFYAGGRSEGEYFTADGKSLRSAFLRSPLEFSRVSSGFSLARMHPVWGTWRAHTGTDFAAPTGTPILATSDGTVDFIGPQNGYGNVVELKHHDQYTTLYGHMSAFASGMHKGTPVRQGQVIGYVGSTGWATGPHVHYEFRIAGSAKDSQGKAVPVAMPVMPGFKAQFDKAAAPLLGQLTAMRETAGATSFE